MVNLAGRKWRSYFCSIYTPYEYNYLEALQTSGSNVLKKKNLMSMSRLCCCSCLGNWDQTFTWLILLQVEEYTLILIFELYPEVFYGDKKGQKTSLSLPLLHAPEKMIKQLVPYTEEMHMTGIEKSWFPLLLHLIANSVLWWQAWVQHRVCLRWVWLDFLKQLWTSSMGIAKFFPSAQSRGLQDPAAGTRAFVAPSLCCWTGLTLQSTQKFLLMQTTSICFHNVVSCREHIFSVQFNELLEISKLLVSQ